MINEPIALAYDSCRDAWIDVVRCLARSQWELRNLVVQIRNPAANDRAFAASLSRFARKQGILTPKQVAYTIFPQGLYRNGRDAAGVFQAYNRVGGIYDRLHHRTQDWGTYFRRMTHYGSHDRIENQLRNIITAIRDRKSVSKAAYTIVIQNPGGETVRPLGGPCLNYVAVQAEPGEPFALGLLAVYRNHEFLERAYGNYLGLCNLLMFMAREVGGVPGPLTCVSSHAYVANKKTALRAFVGEQP